MIIKQQKQIDMFDETRKNDLERAITKAKKNAIRSFEQASEEARNDSDKERLRKCVDKLKGEFQLACPRWLSTDALSSSIA